jgi:hypothetical protein
MPIAGGAITTVAEEQPLPSCISLDVDFVYWANSNPVSDGGLARANAGTINRVPKP